MRYETLGGHFFALAPELTPGINMSRNFFSLVYNPRLNFGEKERLHLRYFVLMGRPKVRVCQKQGFQKCRTYWSCLILGRSNTTSDLLKSKSSGPNVRHEVLQPYVNVPVVKVPVDIQGLVSQVLRTRCTPLKKKKIGRWPSML